MKKHPYVLGTGDAELDRLAKQHDIWRPVTVGLYDEAGFGAGQRLLDLGCGPGFTSFELAERVGPDGKIIALDNSRRFIEVLSGWCRERAVENIDARVADALEPGLPVASVHGAFIRWLLCFLPDPGRVIDAVASALRPGGHLVVMDYFHYLAIDTFPASDIFRHVFGQIHQSFADAGGDLDIGDKLPGLMLEAGLEVIHLEPIIETARPGSAVWQWVRAFQRSYLPQLVKKGYLSADDLDANDADWRQRAENPASFFLSPPMLGVVARKSV